MRAGGGSHFADDSRNQGPAQSADLAYTSRHVDGDRVALHITGLHAIGSLGAIDYLANNAAALHSEVGARGFSMVVRADYDSLTITGTEVVSGPHVW